MVNPSLVNGGTPSPTHATAPFRVAIIGAGIAGLALASALRATFSDKRDAHTAGEDATDVEIRIFERAPETASEVGAAIHLSPNATRLAADWGFERERVGSIVVDSQIIIDSQLSDKRRPMSVTKSETPWLLNHRVALHDEFKHLATASRNDETTVAPARISYGTLIQHIDCEAATVTFQDGRTEQFDLVVGADGVRSQTRSFVLRDPPELKRPQYSGLSGYRGLIPFDLVKNEDNTLVELFKDHQGVYCLARDRKLVLYFFHPDIVSVLQKLDESSLWPLYDISPLPAWSRGRTVIIGDAAHAMLPNLAQGGAQSVEDAWLLANLLSRLVASHPTPSTHLLSKMLQSFEALRFGRTAACQCGSRNMETKGEAPKEDQLKSDREVPRLEFEDFFSYKLDQDPQVLQALEEATNGFA